MSAPAAKALALPVKTIAPTAGSASRERVQVFNSVIRGVKRALRALGRLSVTLAGSVC